MYTDILPDTLPMTVTVIALLKGKFTSVTVYEFVLLVKITVTFHDENAEIRQHHTYLNGRSPICDMLIKIVSTKVYSCVLPFCRKLA